MLRLTVDVIFPPKKGQAQYENTTINKYPVEGYTIEENMWEYLMQIDQNPINSAIVQDVKHAVNSIKK